MWHKRREKAPDGERVIKDPVKARERTMNRAVKLLAAKPRSIGELRERLLEKSWTNAEIVDQVLETLKEYKYVDDEQFASDLALAKLRQRPQGKRRLQHTMSRKQLDRETVDKAIDAAFETIPETDLIDLAVAKWLRLRGRPETRDETKKLYDHLLRQGFGFDLVRDRVASIGSIDERDPD
jgi:regulatory protein